MFFSLIQRVTSNLSYQESICLTFYVDWQDVKTFVTKSIDRTITPCSFTPSPFHWPRLSKKRVVNRAPLPSLLRTPFFERARMNA